MTHQASRRAVRPNPRGITTTGTVDIATPIRSYVIAWDGHVASRRPRVLSQMARPRESEASCCRRLSVWIRGGLTVRVRPCGPWLAVTVRACPRGFVAAPGSMCCPCRSVADLDPCAIRVDPWLILDPYAIRVDPWLILDPCAVRVDPARAASGGPAPTA